ncbi:biotin/lipoyl-binding protein [Spirillospora sp. NPDC127200]
MRPRPAARVRACLRCPRGFRAFGPLGRAGRRGGQRVQRQRARALPARAGRARRRHRGRGGPRDRDGTGHRDAALPAEGTIGRLCVGDGDRVREGQILAEIESPAAREQLAHAEEADRGVSGGGAAVPAGRTVRALTVKAPFDGVASLGGPAGGAPDLGGLLERLPQQAGAQPPAGLGGGLGGGAAKDAASVAPGAPVAPGDAVVTVTDVSRLALSADVSALAISAASPVPAVITWWSPALAFGVSAAVGVFFGVVPARRAGRLDPVTALRTE